MTPLLFIASGCLTICLGLVLARSVFAVISDSRQSRFIKQIQTNSETQANRELTAKLRQTYVDLSMSRRQAVWRQVMVVKIIQESDDVCSFYLVDPDHEPLPASQPGQHILVDRSKKIDGQGACRCYSLSDDCAAGHWRISVKKNSDYPQSMSRWLHEEVSVGDLLKVRGPSGAFYLNSDPTRSIVLVSAGIGVTPMLPMLIESIRRQRKTSIRCFAQFRDVAHMPFADSLLIIASQHQHVDMSIWISRFPKGVKRSSESPIHEGKFQASDLLNHPDAISNTDYYLCGPEDWQDRMQKELSAGGVQTESIRYELFQQSEKPVAVNPDATPRSVHFKQSNSIAKFENGQPSLLGCAAKNHINLESGCRTGACGSCAIKLLHGKVRYTREPQFQTKSNEILPCVCVPESDLVLDA